MNVFNRMRRFEHGFILKIIVVVFVIGTISGISAYFIANETANNQMTIGHVKTEIIEDYEPPKELVPDVSFTKKVQVKNTGPNACYVRALVMFSTSEMEDLCEVDYNQSCWTKEEDGYWYYNDKLSSGEETKPLFTKVHVVKEKNGQEVTPNQMQDFDINIYHESSSTQFNK